MAISLFALSFQSPECHCRVHLLCCSFDVVLILRQTPHFLLSFLDHVLPALHPIQVPFQRLVEKFDRHEVVLRVARQSVAGGLQRGLGLGDLVHDLEGDRDQDLIIRNERSLKLYPVFFCFSVIKCSNVRI